MEDKVFELISKMYSEMQEGFKEVNVKIEGIDVKIDSMEKDVKELKEGQKNIENLILELDPKNANRHLEISEQIEELKKDLNAVEIVTSKNWNDIAKIKAVK